VGKPFSDLTKTGRARRLRQLALTALESYDLAPRRVTTLSTSLNGIFRVDTDSGERFMLRITPPDWRTEPETCAEIVWLLALDRETDIAPVKPLPNRAGEYITTTSVPGVPEPRRCVLFTWVPGVPVADRMNESNVVAMGELAARLHDYAATFLPGEPFSIPHLDQVFKSYDPLLLFDPAYAMLFTDGQLERIDQAISYCQAALDRRFANSDGLRVIHGDFHHENVMVHRGRLRPIDFDEICWGYPAQDISLTFYDFRYFTNPETHSEADLRAWFERGYTRLLPWPEEYPGQIDTFLLARRIWVANWILNHLDPRDGDEERWTRFVEGMLASFSRLPDLPEPLDQAAQPAPSVP
jgi:Ser/Thr protein kinase RdoA (MazF antagonist)